MAGKAPARSFAKPSFAGPLPPGRPSAMKGSVPALVFEAPRVPSVPIQSPLGIALAVTGAVLAGEALISLFGSADQSTFQTVFRLFRITAGGGLLVWVAASSGR